MMMATALRGSVERDALAVGREGRRLGSSATWPDTLFDLASARSAPPALFLGADEIGEPVALRRPRHPRVRGRVDAELDDVVEAEVLVEPRQVARSTRPSPRSGRCPVPRPLAVDGHRGVAEGDGDRRLLNWSSRGSARDRRVRRPLPVAERLKQSWVAVEGFGRTRPCSSAALPQASSPPTLLRGEENWRMPSCRTSPR